MTGVFLWEGRVVGYLELYRILTLMEEPSMDDINMKESNAPRADEKQKGASMIEYAILIALIVVICIVGVRVVGQKVSQQFSSVASQL